MEEEAPHLVSRCHVVLMAAAGGCHRRAKEEEELQLGHPL